MLLRETFPGIRERLEKERASLLDQIATLTSDNQVQQDEHGIGNHLADDATEVFTRERNLALRYNARDLLDQVEAALLRLDDGTYGICARCGREINIERLDALPSATLCITCQSEVERAR